MGIKDSVKLKILQELMQNTNKERPTSIWKLRAAVYRDCEKEWNTLKNNSDKSSKKNMRDSQIKTVKKDVFELEEAGLIKIMDIDENGNIDNKKEVIYYNHPLSQEKLPFLIEHTFTMTATLKEKREIIDDLLRCAGAGNLKKYCCYLEHFSPEYRLEKDEDAEKEKENKYPQNPQVEGEKIIGRAEACCYVNLHENIYRIFEALSSSTGQFVRKISFKLVQYNDKGKVEYVNGGKVYKISPYFISSLNGKLWLVGNHEPYNNLSHYPIERMDNIKILEKGYRKISELKKRGVLTDKYCYTTEHQGGSYGDVEPIILRVQKTPNAYTVMYRTFDNEFYFLEGGTEEYDRVLVFRTAYFIVNWAMMNSRDVIVETPAIQEMIRDKVKELAGLYSVKE